MSTAAKVKYHVSFENANSHNVTVQIDVPAKLLKGEDALFKVPVWTPGSYKVREFARNITDISARSKDGELQIEIEDKHSWRIKGGAGSYLTLTYEIYAFTLGVRESYLDQFMAFLHGPSTFGYIDGCENEGIELSFDLPEGWEAHAALKEKGKGKFVANDYDHLADSPIALGDFEVMEYESGNVPHKVVMMGSGNYKREQIIEDFKKISDEQVKLFGEHPSSPCYIHFIQNVDQGGGGLEHANCQTSQVERFVYNDPAGYRKFLGLISHEYFHLWNVKRIRPIELGPFDYDQENYTEQLWVAEGITSYYDDLILRRVGIHTRESYLEEMAKDINHLQNQRGRMNMSLDQASKLAWVKAYMPDENSLNATISYYNKGKLVAWMLDQLIVERSLGKRSLDDLMRELYTSHFKKEDRGFSHEEFMATASKIADTDLSEFFEKYVFGTQELPYESVLKFYGLMMSDQNKPVPGLGVKTKKDGNQILVTFVENASHGEHAGISVNDEIISVNGWRVKDQLENELKRYHIGEKIEIQFARSGKMHITQMILDQDSTVNYKIESDPNADENAKVRGERWIN